MSLNRVPQNRQFYKRLKAATALPDPCNSIEELREMLDPGQDLIGADRLELRRAWNAVELALLLADRCV